MIAAACNFFFFAHFNIMCVEYTILLPKLNIISFSFGYLFCSTMVVRFKKGKLLVTVVVEKECYEWVMSARVEEVLATKTSLVHLRYLFLQSVLELHQIVKVVQG